MHDHFRLKFMVEKSALFDGKLSRVFDLKFDHAYLDDDVPFVTRDSGLSPREGTFPPR